MQPYIKLDITQTKIIFNYDSITASITKGISTIHSFLSLVEDDFRNDKSCCEHQRTRLCVPTKYHISTPQRDEISVMKTHNNRLKQTTSELENTKKKCAILIKQQRLNFESSRCFHLKLLMSLGLQNNVNH